MHVMLSTSAPPRLCIGKEHAEGLLQLSEVDVFSRRPYGSGKAGRNGRTRGKGSLGNLGKDAGSEDGSILDNDTRKR